MTRNKHAQQQLPEDGGSWASGRHARTGFELSLPSRRTRPKKLLYKSNTMILLYYYTSLRLYFYTTILLYVMKSERQLGSQGLPVELHELGAQRFLCSASLLLPTRNQSRMRGSWPKCWWSEVDKEVYVILLLSRLVLALDMLCWAA